MDVAADMLFLTVDVLGKVAFSYDFGSVRTPTPEDAPVFSAFDTILKAFTRRGNLGNIDWLTAMLRIPTESNRRFDAAMARLEGKVNDIITRRLDRKGEVGEDACEDLLDYFMGRDQKAKRRMSRSLSAMSEVRFLTLSCAFFPFPFPFPLPSFTASADFWRRTSLPPSSSSLYDNNQSSTNSSASSASVSSENSVGSTTEGHSNVGACPVTSVVGGMGRKLVVDNVKTFLFAGHDTTASALSWSLYLISRDTEAGQRGLDVRNRILAEATEAGFDSLTPSCLSASSPSIHKLSFLDDVVKETLRLYPSAGFTRRVPPGKAPVTLGKGTTREVCIPTGVEVFVFPYLLHRDEAMWDDAAVFNPDRWRRRPKDDGEEEDGGGKKAEPYLPFSLGVRNCVGMRLALTEIKTTLLALLQRYEMEWIPNPEGGEDNDGEPRVTLYMTLVPNKVLALHYTTPAIARRPTHTETTTTSNICRSIYASRKRESMLEARQKGVFDSVHQT